MAKEILTMKKDELVEEGARKGLILNPEMKRTDMVAALMAEAPNMPKGCYYCTYFKLNEIKGRFQCRVRGGFRNAYDGVSCDKFKRRT